jgi:SAM-dependent methyltransferase
MTVRAVQQRPRRGLSRRGRASTTTADRVERRIDLPEAASDPKYRHYPETRFGGFSDIDQVIVFYTRVRALMDPWFTVLDIGCGRGKQLDDPVPTRRRLKTLNDACDRVIGIDVDPNAAKNPVVDEFHLLEPRSPWPIGDGAIDLALSDYVLEHVEDPQGFFSECRRVIRPGGYLCMRTTNVLSYYGIASKLLPDVAHPSVIRRVYTKPRADRDIFRTRYRCNTIAAVRRMLDRFDFDHCVYGYQSDPAHFAFSPTLYALGVLHQRVAPTRIRPAIFIFAQRRA